MKKIKVLFYIAICFSINLSFSQLKDTFEKGSILLNNDTKIDGYIKIDELSKLSSEICFKLLKTDEKCENYNSSEIKSFNTENGKYFDVLTLKINNNKKEITVFANLILKGTTSLYKSVFDEKDFYIITRNNINYVLQNDELVSGETEIRQYKYRGILNIATEGQTSTMGSFEFNENNFIKIVSEYNSSKGYESKIVTYNEKKINYIIVNIGGGLKKNETEFFLQAMYRIYYPKISRSTSLNIGLNYLNYQYSELYNNKSYKITQTLTTIPIQIQQNFLNKNFRPYLFAGFDLNHLKIVDYNNNSILKNGLQNNFGIGLLYGAGLELDIYKGLMVKCEYRNEIFTHLFLIGIGYNFSK